MSGVIEIFIICICVYASMHSYNHAKMLLFLMNKDIFVDEESKQIMQKKLVSYMILFTVSMFVNLYVIYKIFTFFYGFI